MPTTTRPTPTWRPRLPRGLVLMLAMVGAAVVFTLGYLLAGQLGHTGEPTPVTIVTSTTTSSTWPHLP